MKFARIALALIVLPALAQQLPRAEITQRKRFDIATTRQLTALARAASDRQVRGTCATLSGGSKADRNLAAELVAQDSSTQLYRVQLAGVVSKYIGETEKNLNLLFERAANAHWTLFFDEADELFGKREGNSDSQDRYANLNTASLLRRIEEYPGLVLIATNKAATIDPAFAKRCASVRAATAP